MTRLAVALHAVSTSPPMPRYEDYIESVETLRSSFTRTNPPGPALVEAFRAKEIFYDPGVGSNIHPSDLIAALSSFTDDYALRPPQTLFAVDAAVSILRSMEKRHCLLVTDQLDVALRCTTEGPFSAVMALHTATRVLARGRDTRLHSAFEMSLEERLERGRAIAPFHPEDALDGDPLGDTYHFWANVVGGLYAACQTASGLRRGFVAGMLYAGPWLMRGIREATFGRPLFYGDHARIDRLGLAIGMGVGRLSCAVEAGLL